MKGKIDLHYRFMVYSYAVCFSGVTLRFWLPTLTVMMGGFDLAHVIVGWLS
jgi:hypothetical protein